MKAILASLLLLFQVGAFAQQPLPPCNPWDSKAENRELTLIPSWPSFIFTDSTKHAFVATWWCDQTYSWSFQSVYGFKDQLDPDAQDKLKQMSNGDRALFESLWGTRLECPNGDITSPGCERYAELIPIKNQIRDSTKPTLIYWGVRDNPTGASRPCYPIRADGTRNPTAVPTTTCRVPDADDPATPAIKENWCTCTRRHLEESGGVYCDVGNLFNVGTATVGDVTPDNVYVALCERKN